jgi:predicted MFS family arabinose efflux permease
MPKDLKLLAARASLAILAIGFLLLGIVSFVWGSKDDPALASSLENQSYYLGGAASVFVGAIFFAAAYVYWKR